MLLMANNMPIMVLKRFVGKIGYADENIAYEKTGAGSAPVCKGYSSVIGSLP